MPQAGCASKSTWAYQHQELASWAGMPVPIELDILPSWSWCATAPRTSCPQLASPAPGRVGELPSAGMPVLGQLACWPQVVHQCHNWLVTICVPTPVAQCSWSQLATWHASTSNKLWLACQCVKKSRWLAATIVKIVTSHYYLEWPGHCSSRLAWSMQFPPPPPPLPMQ